LIFDFGHFSLSDPIDALRKVIAIQYLQFFLLLLEIWLESQHRVIFILRKVSQVINFDLMIWNLVVDGFQSITCYLVVIKSLDSSLEVCEALVKLFLIWVRATVVTHPIHECRQKSDVLFNVLEESILCGLVVASVDMESSKTSQST